MYGMSRDNASHVLDTFLIVRRRDEKLFGDYRTKHMILERYDAMAAAAASGSRYETMLDPAPADPRLGDCDTLDVVNPGQTSLPQ
jgi:hypothetical protein